MAFSEIRGYNFGDNTDRASYFEWFKERIGGQETRKFTQTL